MKELENLLNSLIKIGWKPWGKSVNRVLYIHSKSMLIYLNVINEPKRQIKQDSLRELVSLESGLWQFVCRNRLYKQPNEKFRESVSKVWLNTWWFAHNHQYRLLESSLIPEKELAKFLVENIVVEWLKSEQSKK